MSTSHPANTVGLLIAGVDGKSPSDVAADLHDQVDWAWERAHADMRAVFYPVQAAQTFHVYGMDYWDSRPALSPMQAFEAVHVLCARVPLNALPV